MLKDTKIFRISLYCPTACTFTNVIYRLTLKTHRSPAYFTCELTRHKTLPQQPLRLQVYSPNKLFCDILYTKCWIVCRTLVPHVCSSSLSDPQHCSDLSTLSIFATVFDLCPVHLFSFCRGASLNEQM